MTVLAGTEIRKYMNAGILSILEPTSSTTWEPISPSTYDNIIGAASLDLTLGDEFRHFVHHNGTVAIDNLAGPETYKDLTHKIILKDGESYMLGPGQMCLGITRERVHLPKNLCALVEGRSRFARLGLSVHITASFINPGVRNQTVLEIFNASSLTLALKPGTKVCQMIFMMVEGEGEYRGNFNNQEL